MKIVTDKPMSQMTEAEQEEIWKLSRTNEVYEEDVNGKLWRVIDLGNEKSENILLKVRENHGKDDNLPANP